MIRSLQPSSLIGVEPISVLVLGDYQSGKSSLIQHMLHAVYSSASNVQEVCPSSVQDVYESQITIQSSPRSLLFFELTSSEANTERIDAMLREASAVIFVTNGEKESDQWKTLHTDQTNIPNLVVTTYCADIPQDSNTSVNIVTGFGAVHVWTAVLKILQ